MTTKQDDNKTDSPSKFYVYVSTDGRIIGTVFTSAPRAGDQECTKKLHDFVANHGAPCRWIKNEDGLLDRIWGW